MRRKLRPPQDGLRDSWLVIGVTVCIALTALVGGPAGLAHPLVAFAHTELGSSTPADGDIVTNTVSEVVLTFTDSVEPVADGFEVFLPSTEVVQAVPETADDITFVLNFDPPVGSGEVGVRFEVISADGHPVTGSFAFIIDAPLPVPTNPPTTAPVVSAAPAVVTTTPGITIPGNRCDGCRARRRRSHWSELQ